MDADPVVLLADDIQQTKDMITKIGRQIFRLSSDLAALMPDQLASFRWPFSSSGRDLRRFLLIV
ncbi:MAG: hypothetical protein CMP86_02795 [Gammaproteobacteria bacterium]|nr:hypothetical protein [Gammaproteobacteria bacterium]|tara:strand:- start:465 stop:656 length:192 start_codon:yes stop_codon:yes gene_type:complete